MTCPSDSREDDVNYKPLMAILSDPLKFYRFFNRLVPLHAFIGLDGDRMVRCPFHADDTPSAKPYPNEDGTVHLYCFGCQKQYTAYDFVKKIEKKDPRTFLFSRFPRDVLAVHALEPVGPVVHARDRKINVDLEEAARLLPDVSAYVNAVYEGVHPEEVS